MKQFTKKLITLTLAICCLIAPFATIANAAEIQPRFNNTMSTVTAMSINSSGKLVIAYNYVGYPGITTRAEITTYVQKRTLWLFWTRVDIGTPDNEWVDTSYQEDYTYERSFQLSDEGTYRVTVEYKIYGTGGEADVIDYQGTDTY